MQFANVPVLAAALIVTIAPALLAPRLIAQAATSAAGCIGRDELNNQLTPVELYSDVAGCIDLEKYDGGLFLFAVAATYSRFDNLRVKDPKAQKVAVLLPVIIFSSLDKTKVAAFQDRVKQMSGNDSLNAKYCRDLESMNRPATIPPI